MKGMEYPYCPREIDDGFVQSHVAKRLGSIKSPKKGKRDRAELSRMGRLGGRPRKPKEPSE
jgi:hypothetical protein